MNRIPSSFLLSLATAAVCLVAGLPQVQAASPSEGTIDLLTTPPELTAKVAPNVVLTFDDSGSMTWRHMPDERPYSGVGWGAGSGQTESNNDNYPSGAGPYLCAGIIDPTLEPDPANPRTWSMNGVYYNPRATYRPPMKADGTSFPNSSFTAAWVNGIKHNRPTNQQSSTIYDLSKDTTKQGRRFCDSTAGWYQLKSGVTLTLGADGKLDSASLTRLYTPGNWEWVDLPLAQRQNFANWYSYYHTRVLAAISATSLAYADFDDSIHVAWQNINANTSDNPWVSNTNTTLDAFAGTTRDNFYDWLLNSPSTGSTPNQAAAKRVGELFTRGKGVKNSKNPYWDEETQRELSCRKNFHIQMTDGMWNGSTQTVAQTDTTAATLPDGRDYSVSDLQTKIFWNEGSAAQKTMADIAFHYWATDLRPDFKDNEQTRLKVRPYLSDRTTGITGTAPLQPGDSWLDNQEIYWNPANDPATWPHLVQYMIGFGVDGTIPKTDANYLALRKGTIQWPKLDGTGVYTDNSKKIDDMWHAAINSRGEFFAAANPDELIDAMRKIIASVVAQSTSSTPAAVSLPILTGGNSAYQGGYDTTGWPGSVRRYQLDAAGVPATVLWDAGCLLTGGTCAEPAGINPARDPNDRVIVTSDGAPGTGRAFRWTSLTGAQKNALNQKPGAAACAGSGPECDTYGSDRLDYLRGKRDLEATGATPLLRQRVSLLGAVVNGEPAYVSSPRSGYHDMFPTGSPEADAAALDEDDSYAGYQNAQRKRDPMVYVGANDGMLHAFDAATGKEAWAYIPDVLIRNGRLASSTLRDAGLTPGADAKPRERDVFINGKWRTILLGSLRLGGRGVYALDVTMPKPAGETSAATAVPLWEFSSGETPSADSDPPCALGSRTCPSLGYTYDSANVARIKYDNKWVALVSSGYFPANADAAARPGDISEAAAKRTSLLVIDLETGKLIREIKTSTAPQLGALGGTFKTFGLSTPMVYDEGGDEVDDLAYAGDLAGNLWRFDLSSDKPADWTVDLMFRSTGNGGAAKQGDQPIVFNPTALRDPVTRRPILVFGTGKYLGEDDRTSAIPEQAFYGIRDYGTASTAYPIMVNQLITQTLGQDADNTRKVTGYIAPTGTLPSGTPVMRVPTEVSGKPAVASVVAHGWRMPLKITTEKGERAQRRAIPLPSANVALLYGLIPKSDDPCDPGARYSIMALDAATGAAIYGGGGMGTGKGLVGAVIAAPTPPSDPVSKRGGGGGVIVGLPAGVPPAVKKALDDILSAAIPPWHRGAWRELLDW